MKKYEMIAKNFLTSDGIQISYSVLTVPKAAACFVFLHGLGGEYHVWDETRLQLAQLGFESIAFDLRGSGRSGRPEKLEAYTLGRIAADVLEVLEQENIENIVLVGHCLGGIIAQYCATQSSLFKALVLINTSFESPAYIVPFHFIMFPLLSIIRLISSRKFDSTPIDYPSFEGSTNLSPRRLISDIRHTSLKSYLALWHAGFAVSVKDKLGKIKIPTLILSGTNDIIFPPATAQKLQKLIPAAQLTLVEHANHPFMFHEQNRIRLITYLCNFVNSLK